MGGGIIIHPNALHFLLFGKIKQNKIHNAREGLGKDSVFACLVVCYCESLRLYRLKNGGGKQSTHKKIIIVHVLGIDFPGKCWISTSN